MALSHLVSFQFGLISLAAAVGLYAVFLGLLTTATFQSHVVYLHAIQMTWFRDLNLPETFGFLRNQVTPFSIKTADNEHVYAWHVLPIELYLKRELALTAEQTSFARDITSRLAFRLLRDDPEARLVIHMHGAGGTVASGYRVPNYRALSAGHPGKIHGTPSEAGLIQDALAVTNWAIYVAGVPASQIVIFGGSIGTAAAVAVAHHFASQWLPTVFAGTVLVAPFVNGLFLSYRLRRFPALFEYLLRFIPDKWLTSERIMEMVRTSEVNEEKYRLTNIHAENDWDVPSHHSELLFWHAVNESVPFDLGAAGTIMEWRTKHGVIREEILKSGLHDVIMGYPVITMAVMRHFEATDPSFTV
ncbi:Alpha/Beta hydrolase protein [Aspergillus spinulosporus]